MLFGASSRNAYTISMIRRHSFRKACGPSGPRGRIEEPDAPVVVVHEQVNGHFPFIGLNAAFEDSEPTSHESSSGAAPRAAPPGRGRWGWADPPVRAPHPTRPDVHCHCALV